VKVKYRGIALEVRVYVSETMLRDLETFLVVAIHLALQLLRSDHSFRK
jgi:hypothetical protein